MHVRRARSEVVMGDWSCRARCCFMGYAMPGYWYPTARQVRVGWRRLPVKCGQSGKHVRVLYRIVSDGPI